MDPPAPTLLDWVQTAGRATHAVGKIGDIFSMKGVGKLWKGKNDLDLFDHLDRLLADAEPGSLTFANFVEFDSLYGHPRDVAGYARALEWFDARAGAFLATLRPGMPLRMVVDAVQGKVFEGKVDRISPVVDSGSGTFRVVCAFEGGGTLRPGMFGRIEVVYDERVDALTMPRVALLEDEGEPEVFVVRENKAVRVPVELGYVNGELAEVRSGLVEGDDVVTAGKVAIRDGSEVEVINAASPEASTETAVAQVAVE